MCGIVGYVGKRDAANIILTGLHRLEYRGYDSAGIALRNPVTGNLDLVKTPGKIEELERLVEAEMPHRAAVAGLGIGHTRWATHGEPTWRNAHPHLSSSGDIAIVHNGIVENYLSLKQWLTADGCQFQSDTDSEVIAQLIELCYSGDLTEAVTAALQKIEGTYGILVISKRHPNTLVTARQGSPIAVGVCKNETIVASDMSALVQYTKQVILLNDGDILTASGSNIEIRTQKHLPVSRETIQVDWDLEQIKKDGHDHFMLKEIHEQPEAIANSTRGRLVKSDGTTKLSGMLMDAHEMARIDHLIIAACGTSLYAAMVGELLFEDLANIPTEVQQAAEFRYRNPLIQRDSYFLAVSQSGETADTLAAVREAKRKGAVVLGICNVVGSTIARECGRGVYLHAGPEIGVASTKAFSCQIAVLAMMAIALGRTRRMSIQEGMEKVSEMLRLPESAAEVLEQEAHIAKLADKYAKAENCFFIGRGYMYPAALEGALKLKEISYMHAEGYHAAELKHGPIALLTDKVPVVALVPDIQGKEKTIGNMQECRARKAPVIAIATEGDNEIQDHCDDLIRVPRCMEFLTPIPVVIAAQLFAYHVARQRGCPIDQPRNLAKSVTVE
jgi:glucosamine--fructose-6-phosphate aminotransferase (isomerizing)